MALHVRIARACTISLRKVHWTAWCGLALAHPYLQQYGWNGCVARALRRSKILASVTLQTSHVAVARLHSAGHFCHPTALPEPGGRSPQLACPQPRRLFQYTSPCVTHSNMYPGMLSSTVRTPAVSRSVLAIRAVVLPPEQSVTASRRCLA